MADNGADVQAAHICRVGLILPSSFRQRTPPPPPPPLVEQHGTRETDKRAGQLSGLTNTFSKFLCANPSAWKHTM